MLTAPPEPDHCEIVVRYVPAAAGAEIGGDWYDAFMQADGATVLAIGDVVGHDTRAAAAMGQVRGLLRGIGYASGGSPAEVLTELDRAMQGLALDTMATALVARLEQDDVDLRASQTRLRWSSAGHPPPVAARPPTARRRCSATSTLRPAARRQRRTSQRTERVAVLDARRHRAALHRRPGRAARPGPRRRARPSWSTVLRECAGPPARRAVRPGAGAAVPARRRGRRRHPRRPPAPAGRAPARRRPGPSVVPPTIEPAPDVIPEAGTEA